MALRARLGAALFALVAFVIVLVGRPLPARAWVDVRVEADDVRVSVDRGGDARVEHKITLKIAGGPLRSIDLRGVDADAVPEPDGYVVPQKEAARGSLASAQAVATEKMAPDVKPLADGSPAPPVIRVRFDAERGLSRGVYVLLVRYTTRLGGRIVVGGPFARLAWRGLVWDDGFDSARVTFELPAAPTEPRADDAGAGDAEGGARAPLVLSTLRRGTAKDQIELLRPYAPKGEAITWAIRADARAFQPTAPPVVAKPSGMRAAIDGVLGEPGRRLLLFAGALSLFLLYASLVALKTAETARYTRAAGAVPRPLVPIPNALRAIFAGAALVAGVLVQLVFMRATVGAILVLAAVMLAAHRTPEWKRPALRGPGRWLPIAETVALREPPRPSGAWLDASTRAGKAFMLLSIGAVIGAAVVLHDTSPFRAELVAFDAVALLVIFGTGRIAELPPDPALAPTRLLREVTKRVRKAFPADRLRVVGRIRVPDGSADPDELRLAIAPKVAPPGFGAIEVGVLFARGAGGAMALPEVILRVTSGSPCDQALAQLSRHGRATRGRKKDERAIVLSPRLPTVRMTAGIVIRLLKALEAARVARPVHAARTPARRAA
ncbi:Hypothetical protein A7982_08446 [Minicystis rosea]|nr:Hypothetical protein A7982_08446 [Minicystis rosea]